MPRTVARLPPEAIDPILQGEAADWLVRFQSGDDSASTRCAFARWLARSPAHAAAWQRAEAVLGTFRQVPVEIGRQTLDGLARPGRRRVLHAMGMLVVGTPAVVLAWRHRPWEGWHADLRTATGEQKTLELADGTHLVLNTNTAVDVVYTPERRMLHLIQGEILVTTGKDDSRGRPFVVESAAGTARPLGTRFSLRHTSSETRVGVFAGAVWITTRSGLHHDVQAGRQVAFQAGHISPDEVQDADAALWADGMFLARDISLADLVAELARYRPGVLRCHPAVAAMRVSGAFPLRDTDAALDLLLRTRPLALRSVTRYWVSVEPLPT